VASAAPSAALARPSRTRDAAPAPRRAAVRLYPTASARGSTAACRGPPGPGTGSRSSFPTESLAVSARESGPDRACRRHGEGLPRPVRPGDRPPIFPPRCSSSSVAAGRHTYLEQIRVLIARRSKNVRKGVARIQVHGITEYDLGSGVSSVHRASRRPGQRRTPASRGHRRLPARLVFAGSEVMIDRGGRGHPYCDVRGEILGSSQDEQLRRRLSSTFPLIKNESQRFEGDQIPP